MKIFIKFVKHLEDGDIGDYKIFNNKIIIRIVNQKSKLENKLLVLHELIECLFIYYTFRNPNDIDLYKDLYDMFKKDFGLWIRNRIGHIFGNIIEYVYKNLIKLIKLLKYNKKYGRGKIFN